MTVYEVPAVGSGVPDDPTRPLHADALDGVQANLYYEQGGVVKVAVAESIPEYEEAADGADSDVRKLDATEMHEYDVPEAEPMDLPDPEDGEGEDTEGEEDSETDTEE